MNAYILVFAAVVGVALCAPLTDNEEAGVQLVQKTHKLYKAGVVDDTIVDTACTVAHGLACKDPTPGTACKAIDTACGVIKDPVGKLLSFVLG